MTVGSKNCCGRGEERWGKGWVELNAKGAIWVRGDSEGAHQERRLPFLLH